MIEKIYSLFLDKKQISTDTRFITEGSLFFALKGEHFDAHTFVKKALEGGASYCIIDNKKYKLNDQCIWVDDVLSTLQELAKHHRKQQSIPFIGITGTNGKTTTKELIHAVLSERYRCHATKGNFNNHIGVPLTILSMPFDTEIALIEMGANHPGEIDFLCSIAQPDFGLITNIGKAHLEGFGDFEGVVNTKTELYHYIKKQGGTLFVNADNPLLVEKAQDTPSVTYGSSSLATYKSSFKSANPYLELYFEKDDLVYTIKTQLFGSYNFENAAAALGVGQFFRVPDFDIKTALENYISKNNRSEYLKTSKNEIYLDAYNANPSSMKAAVENFTKLHTQWPKSVILGSMKELGDTSLQEHQLLFDSILSAHFNSIFLIGEEFEFSKENEACIWFKNTAEAKEYFLQKKIEHSSVLIKGSRSNQLELLVEVL